MEYEVVSISPGMGRGQSIDKIAERVQRTIQQHIDAGWVYVGTEHVTSHVSGSNGCFGVGAQPGFDINVLLLIFKQ